MKYCPECKADIEIKSIDGEPRKVCSNTNCEFVFWNNPVPVVAALVELNGEYVIARNASWPEGVFSVIAGYLEAGETPEQAVIRELEEELGLSGNIQRYIGSYSFFEKNQLIIAYEVQAAGHIEINYELAQVKLLSDIELANYDFSPLEITAKIVSDWSNFNS
ncbi:hypothetical protein MNBD_GAMMA22-1272 [hydrothermal vent metagenome]|uniref:Nudix hydrolase domain-containing protein n=1 Tax=hydrothermal vent metagenome TaxID=652676 RepID=A0A3B1A9G6_9ZZZZ